MFKKLLFILSFLICAVTCFAQYPIKQNLGSSTTLVTVPSPGGFQASLINGNFADTTQANLSPIIFYPGAMVFTSSDNRLWLRNANASAWISVGSSSGSNMDVFLIAGQSNAVGNSTQPSLEPLPKSGTVNQFYLGAFSQVTTQVGTSNGCAWQAFGITYNNLTGHTICFVPAGVNGTSMASAANVGFGTWDTTGTLYDTSVARLNAAIAALTAAGYTPTFKGVLWSQGETDADGINRGNINQGTYSAAFAKLIGKYRSVYGKTMPFYIFRTGFRTDTIQTGYLQVQATQKTLSVADSLTNIIFWNAADFPARGLMVNNYHYTQAGYNEMGQIGAQNIINSSGYSFQTQAGNVWLPNRKLGMGIGLPVYPIDIYKQGLAFPVNSLDSSDFGFKYRIENKSATANAGAGIIMVSGALTAQMVQLSNASIYGTGSQLLVGSQKGTVITTDSFNLDFNTNGPYSPANAEFRITQNGAVGLGNNVTPVASSIFDVVGTTRGSRPAPSMTGTQMNAISSPATGLLIYNTDSLAFCWYNGSVWSAFGSGSSSGSGTDNTNSGAGFRWLTPSTQAIKTLFNGYAIIPDSSSNTNGITLKADSANLATRGYVGKVRDSLGTIFTPMSRTLTAGYGVIGGGDLSANRTFTADSFNLSTRGYVGKVRDSLASLPKVSSVALTMPSAFSVAGSPITSSGTFAVTGAGTTAQYIRGDGSLATFSAGTPQIENFGLLYSDSAWADLSRFVQSGTTFTDSSGHIIITGGSSDFTKSLNIDYNQKYAFSNWHTNMEHWRIRATIKVITHGIIPIGIRSTIASGTQLNATAFINTATGLVTFLENSTTNLTVNLGDYIDISAERNGTKTFISVRNITTNSAPVTVSSSYVIPVGGIPPAPNTGQFAVFAYSGKFYLETLTVSSNEMRYADIGIIGDSKSQGYNGTFLTRYPTQLANFYSVMVHAGGNETTADWLTSVDEVVYLAPKIVYMTNPSNDLRTGINTDSTKARYYRVERRLRDAGIAVYHLNSFYETSTNTGTWATYINTSRSVDSVINTYTPGIISGFVDVDNIHPSVYGMGVIYQTVISAGKGAKASNVWNEPDNFIQNQAITPQVAGFTITGVPSTLASNFTVGSSTANVATLKLLMGTGFRLDFGNAGNTLNYMFSYNGSSTYLPFGYYASTHTFNCGSSASVAGLILGTAGDAVFDNKVFLGKNAAGVVQLKVTGETNVTYQLFSNGGIFNEWYTNNALSAGVPATIRASSLIIGNYTLGGAQVDAITIGTTSAVTINNGGLAINTIIKSDNDANMITVDGTNDRVGIGVASPAAWLQVKAGTTASAPFKLTSGTNLSTTQAGAIEYDGTHLYFTAANAGTRFQLDQQTSSGITINSTAITSGTANRVLFENASNQVSESANLTFNTSSQLQIGGTTNFMAFQGGGTTNAGLYFSTNNPTAGASGFALSFNSMTINEAGSGTHSILGAVIINPPTIGTGAAAVTSTATLYIPDAPSASGAINNSLWIAAGTLRSDANVVFNGLPITDTTLAYVGIKADGTLVKATKASVGFDVLDYIGTDVNNSSTTETDLYSYTIPANTLLTNGESGQSKYWGTFNDVTATATMKVKFGGTTIYNSGAITVSSTGSWEINVTVLRTGTTTARATVTIQTPTASSVLYASSINLTGIDFTATNIFVVTGQAGGATGGSSDITLQGGKIWWTSGP